MNGGYERVKRRTFTEIILLQNAKARIHHEPSVGRACDEMPSLRCRIYPYVYMYAVLGNSLVVDQNVPVLFNPQQGPRHTGVDVNPRAERRSTIKKFGQNRR